MSIPVIQLDNGTASPIVLINLGLTVPGSGSVVATGNPNNVMLCDLLSDPQLHVFVDAGDITFTVDGTALTANQSIAYVEYTNIGDNYAATGAPTVNDDADAGYSVGSVWIDVSSDTAYLCVDHTNNAAVWATLGGDAAFGTPVSVGSTNSAGTAQTHSRSDHVHAHGNRPGGSEHAVATTSVNGFMSAADKTKLDNLVINEGDSEFSSTVLATSLGTFQDAFPGQNITVPTTGNYLIWFGCNIGGSSGNTVNEIGITRNAVIISDSTRLIQGNGGAALSSICHTVIALTAGDTITGVWRKNAGSGTSTVGNRRITIMRSNVTP
jgi:hypothetical protein